MGSAFRRVLQMVPEDLTALSNRAYSLRKLGRLDEAAADYGSAIMIGPPNARLYNNRAYCLAKLGKYQAAIKDYEAVLMLDPGNTHALHNRCELNSCCQTEQSLLNPECLYTCMLYKLAPLWLMLFRC